MSEPDLSKGASANLQGIHALVVGLLFNLIMGYANSYYSDVEGLQRGVLGAADRMNNQLVNCVNAFAAGDTSRLPRGSLEDRALMVLAYSASDPSLFSAGISIRVPQELSARGESLAYASCAVLIEQPFAGGAAKDARGDALPVGERFNLDTIASVKVWEKKAAEALRTLEPLRDDPEHRISYLETMQTWFRERLYIAEIHGANPKTAEKAYAQRTLDTVLRHMAIVEEVRKNVRFQNQLLNDYIRRRPSLPVKISLLGAIIVFAVSVVLPLFPNPVFSRNRITMVIIPTIFYVWVGVVMMFWVFSIP